MRNYGRVLQDLVAYAKTMTDDAERNRLAMYIAQTMIVRNQVWNKDQESSTDRVLADLSRMSEGALTVDAAALEASMVGAPRYQPANGKKKKK